MEEKKPFERLISVPEKTRLLWKQKYENGDKSIIATTAAVKNSEVTVAFAGRAKASLISAINQYYGIV